MPKIPDKNINFLFLLIRLMISKISILNSSGFSEKFSLIFSTSLIKNLYTLAKSYHIKKFHNNNLYRYRKEII